MYGGFSNGFSNGFGSDVGTYRFLADHWVNNEIISAGEVRHMYNWVPTGDVDPLDVIAVIIFYAEGPSLGSTIISQWTNQHIAPPATYWHQISPAQWALTGLGANQSDYPPIRAIIGRL